MLSGEKPALRSEMRRVLSGLDPLLRADQSHRVREWLVPRVSTGSVLAFAPLAEEVDLWPLLELLAASGRLVLPRVHGATLLLHRIASLESLRTGFMHLREPAPDALPVDVRDVDVALIPGLAFTPAGARLGRGKGMFDRTLSGLRPDASRIGVCFGEQRVPVLPMEAHDVWMTEVVPDFRPVWEAHP